MFDDLQILLIGSHCEQVSRLNFAILFSQFNSLKKHFKIL